MTEWTEANAKRVDEEYKAPTKVDYTPPSDSEKEVVEWILTETDDLVKQLKCPTPDIIGEFRVARFLRANDGKKKKALKSFRRFLEIRLENDHFLERARQHVEGWTPQQMLEFYDARKNPTGTVLPYCGDTPEGDMVVYAFAAGNDTNAFLKMRPDDRAVDYEIWMWIVLVEWRFMHLDSNCRKYNRMCYSIEIRDMAGQTESGIKTMVNTKIMQFWKAFNELSTICWCEAHSVCVMVNANTATRIMLTMLKPIMTQRTRNKMLCVGDENKESNQKKVQKYLPKDMVPKLWGGDGTNTFIEKGFKEVREDMPLNRTAELEKFSKTPTKCIFANDPINYANLPEPALSKQIDPKNWLNKTK